MSRGRSYASRRPDVTAFLGPGRSLDESARRRLGARLGPDLPDVRVHDDERAALAARVLGARGFALGRDVVLGARDDSLLAHEVAHVVQQQRAGRGGDPEAGAREAERGGAVSPEQLGSAPTGLYLQEETEEERRPTTLLPALRLDWGALRRTSPGFGLGPLLPPLGVSPILTPPDPILTPPAPARAGGDPASSPNLPSRLSVASSGRFSLGLRLGFPEPELRTIPGAPPSALTESLKRAQLINQRLTGVVPQGWDAIDKAELARAVWGIFSTNIAPDVAQKITSGLTRSSGAGGLSYELDLVLFSDFSGGGISFSVSH